MTTDNNNNFYIDKKDFFRETLLSIKNDQITNELAEMFFTLSEKYRHHRHFVRYHHIKDDMVALGVLACCHSIKYFKPLKKTEGEWDGEEMVDYHYKTCNDPFAFFTTCIRNEWYQFLKKYYNHKNACNAMRVQQGLDPDYGYSDMMKTKADRERAADKKKEIEPTNNHGIEW